MKYDDDDDDHNVNNNNNNNNKDIPMAVNVYSAHRTS
jgi:hypothetical protein